LIAAASSPAPAAATILSDFGADVIKIEPPEQEILTGISRSFPAIQERSELCVDARFAQQAQLALIWRT